MSEKQPLLRLTDIAKSFPGTQALNGVDFSLYAGEVHALIGENGAGKSTLIKVIAGLYQQDSGSIEVEGNQVEFHSPADSLEHRIKVVYQELDLVPDLSIAENVFLGNLPKKAFRMVDWNALYSQTSELLLDLGLEIDPGDTDKCLDRSPAAVGRDRASAISSGANHYHGRADIGIEPSRNREACLR